MRYESFYFSIDFSHFAARFCWEMCALELGCTFYFQQATTFCLDSGGFYFFASVILPFYILPCHPMNHFTLFTWIGRTGSQRYNSIPPFAASFHPNFFSIYHFTLRFNPNTKSFTMSFFFLFYFPFAFDDLMLLLFASFPHYRHSRLFHPPLSSPLIHPASSVFFP